MRNVGASQFHAGEVCAPSGITRYMYTLILLDSCRLGTIISTSYLSNRITLMAERDNSMDRERKLLRDLLINIGEGVLVYIVLLLATWFTWWLTEKLWMPPILTFALMAFAFLVLVCGTILCAIYIVYTSNDYIKKVYGEDWWQRFRSFFRRLWMF